ncbi:MAG: helix-turn-helix domain-containing protein [Ruminococcaceae bacterium]|nr:helix-turn-helix domain-containing protein [Oscillospiraceae bacterium]
MIWKPVYIKEQIRIDSFYSFFVATREKDFNFTGETHNFWEILYVIKGNVGVSADDLVYELSQGDIIFHKPMEMHKFYILGSKATTLTASFDMQGALCDYFKDKVFRLSHEQQGIIKKLISFANMNSYANDTLDDNMTDILSYAKNNSLYLNKISTYLHELFLSLGEKGTISDISTATDALVFKNAVNYMNENIYNNPKVSEIAKHCFLSESGLKRLFTKYAGLSIHRYFLKLKFKAAIELLSNGISVSEVAQMLNFSSQSYFSTSFKKEYGVSPTEYSDG